ncbi:threonine/serine exporter family protein [Sediminitomix flava]|uniref:Uncharacterized membrane protein YjjP (DUF1212 family) n=1 Tax=Sediminitomix flava TaxID=379075 RepID=A0A315ZE11_SEDFL|nr:threonine/serine exporter family protein [Sediminitomix flava]PWJ42984.1 uncharacterized membrane protein YjjP (DUF1212 family) [Sediminitomix flava]
MEVKRIVKYAAEAGKLILENGGETYRVEDTIRNIGYAYGLKVVDSFVTPTGIMISCSEDGEETYSMIKRVSQRTVNLEVIRRVNALSRRIGEEKPSIDEVKQELENIKNIESYSSTTTFLFSALAAGVFCLLYGGVWQDFLVATLLGGIINLLSKALSWLSLTSFLTNVIGGALCIVFGSVSTYLEIGQNADKISIGGIMLLVPGLAITNAMRDLIAGDLVSGMSRAMEAFFIAIAIAVGAAIAYKLSYI